MSKLPLLGVICNRRAHDGGTGQSVNHTYLDAISAWMNVQPILIPANRTFTDSQAADNLLSAIDGLLLTGNRSNVHPKNYEGTETPEHPPFDTARDAVSLELIKRALRRNMPTLAICRGLQELNVACGGSLTAGLSGQKNKLDHRTVEAEDQDAVYCARHGVTFVEDGWWHKLTDRTRAQVNSLHNQAIDRLAQGLVADAHAEDGTIEAVYKPDHSFCVGVQWHPEYQTGENHLSEPLFGAFNAAIWRAAADK
ncbi:MAG: gamma-glutamyl-gamma-aminobutyrate hydrolase family protein [Pseudomonadota bacterium]|nr:gamma-glutamyl-gamma-aminobutyrate hydrolase family protein [Pseudomonadota bacterium]